MHWDKSLSVDGITLTVIHHSTLRHLLKHVMNTSVFIIYFPPYPPTKPHLRVFDLGSPKSLMLHQKNPSTMSHFVLIIAQLVQLIFNAVRNVSEKIRNKASCC